MSCRTKSFTDSVLYGRPRPCRTKSESQASTSQLRQADRRQGRRKALTRPNGAKANARRSLDQAAPRQSQDTHQDKQRRGKLPPQLRQADRRQGTRKALARPSSARAIAGHPSRQATPRQAPAEQTHQDKQRQTKRRQVYKPKSPAPRGDRRFQLQRSGTISSGPLKKLRVSCVHERDGKQVPCVRSLCSYARESRAC